MHIASHVLRLRNRRKGRGQRNILVREGWLPLQLIKIGLNIAARALSICSKLRCLTTVTLIVDKGKTQYCNDDTRNNRSQHERIEEATENRNISNRSKHTKFSPSPGDNVFNRPSILLKDTMCQCIRQSLSSVPEILIIQE